MTVLVFGCLLLCFLASPARAEVDPYHLCHKVTSGAFDAIHLKSITFYGLLEVYVYESDRRYIMARHEISNSADFLSVQRWSQWNVGAPLARALREMGLTSAPRALYVFAYANPDRFWWLVRNAAAKEGIWLNVITDDAEYLWDFWCTILTYQFWEEEAEECAPHQVWRIGRLHPDYALVMEQHVNYPSGYVMHRDIYDQTNQSIIYDLEIDRRFVAKYHYITVELGIHKVNATLVERSKAYYYYIEKTDRPDQVRLVHRRNYDAPRPGTPESRPLIDGRQHPVGYKLGSSVFLFDQARGCVYMIRGMPDSLRTQYEHQVDLVLGRKNIPYEQFFRCNAMFAKSKNFYAKHPADRCETSLRERRTTTTEDPSRGFFTTSVTAVLCGIAALLVLFLVVYCWLPRKLCRGHKRKRVKTTAKPVKGGSSGGQSTSPTKKGSSPSTSLVTTTEKQQQHQDATTKQIKDKPVANTMSNVLAK